MSDRTRVCLFLSRKSTWSPPGQWGPGRWWCRWRGRRSPGSGHQVRRGARPPRGRWGRPRCRWRCRWWAAARRPPGGSSCTARSSNHPGECRPWPEARSRRPWGGWSWCASQSPGRSCGPRAWNGWKWSQTWNGTQGTEVNSGDVICLSKDNSQQSWGPFILLVLEACAIMLSLFVRNVLFKCL